jgi:hypothetical protein
MLNALLIGNPASALGQRLAGVRVPGRWITDPSTVTADDVRGAELIALFGGDGTMQITLSRLLEEIPTSELPPVALLPFGTTNMNAADINRARGRKAAVARLDREVRSGRDHRAPPGAHQGRRLHSPRLLLRHRSHRHGDRSLEYRPQAGPFPE